MSKNIVFEGWLTKSPPTKRIWRTKWRRRWFALRQSGELPGQYFLDYYADRNCRRLKGTINLDLCEQVDAGLHMERSNNVTLDPKLRGSVFTIQTQSRTYHLEADCEADMVKWVDAICSVCGLQPKDNASNDSDPYEKALQMSTISDRYADTSDPYIPISECITGVRAQNSQKAFTFDPKDIVIRTRRSQENVQSKSNQMYLSQPHIRFHNAEFSENDSNISDEECKSLNASQSNIREWAAARSFARNTPRPIKYGEYHHGPPVPPRPPKTLAMSRGIFQRDYRSPERNNQSRIGHQQQVEVICHQPRRRMTEGTNSNIQVPVPVSVHEPVRVHASVQTIAQIQTPEPVLVQAPTYAPAPVTPPTPMQKPVSPPSPVAKPQHIVPIIKITDDDEERMNQSMQYSNLMVACPPAVDRALKPRHSSHSIGNVNTLGMQSMTAANERGEFEKEKITNNAPVSVTYANTNYVVQPPSPKQLHRTVQFSPDTGRSDVLQYLDLDLPAQPSNGDKQRKTIEAVHGKSWSAVEASSAYKTVDFLKTEAFNITRQDAEASRNSQH